MTKREKILIGITCVVVLCLIVAISSLIVFVFANGPQLAPAETDPERYTSAEYEYIGIGRNAYHFSYTWKVVGADLPDGTDTGVGFDVISVKRNVFGQQAAAFRDELITYIKDGIVTAYREKGFEILPEQINIVINSLSLLSI